MKHHPILFSTPMVQAILSGQKTMTRRQANIHKNAELHYWPVDIINSFNEQLVHFSFWKGNTCCVAGFTCPYGKVGDVLWVRETFGYYSGRLFYRANDSLAVDKWKPSIFMPKSVCRLFLEITNIKAQRLHNISEEDILAEGIRVTVPEPQLIIDGQYRLATESELLFSYWEALWCKINGRASWDANPWVWAITFKKIDKPANF